MASNYSTGIIYRAKTDVETIPANSYCMVDNQKVDTNGIEMVNLRVLSEESTLVTVWVPLRHFERDFESIKADYIPELRKMGIPSQENDQN